MIAIDTNLLIYAHRGGCPEHQKAKRAIEHASTAIEGWCIPFPCLLEFWSVVTHPASVGGASSPALALRFIDALIATGRAQILEPGANLAERCLQAAERLGVTGPRVFDLQIGLLCVEGGAKEIWTHDAGFIAMPGLKVRDPLMPTTSPPASGR
jgi:predicted nucleic acid-binding protein